MFIPKPAIGENRERDDKPWILGVTNFQTNAHANGKSSMCVYMFFLLTGVQW